MASINVGFYTEPPDLSRENICAFGFHPTEGAIALYLDLNTAEVPRSKLKGLRRRRGWLRIGHCYFRFQHVSYEREILTCVDDKLEFIPPGLARHLLEMTPTRMDEVDTIEPSSTLDAIQDALIHDFVRACQRESYNFVRRHSEHVEQKLKGVEERYANAIVEIEILLRRLRSELRMRLLEQSQREIIEEKISAIETEYEKLPYALLRERRDIKSTEEQIERDVMASHGRPPFYEQLYVIRWHTSS